MNKKVIIIGAGGHAKVIADIVIKSGDQLLGFLDDIKSGTLLGFPILGNIVDSVKYSEIAEFILAIGDNLYRNEISKALELIWYTAVHPTAVLGMDVIIGDGTVVMANVVINTSAVIGQHCIINSGAIIEHDNVIGDFVHLSPNVTLGGTVTIGSLTHIGIGAVIKNNISIVDDVKIGAGTVVVKNIQTKGTYIGVPARIKCEL